MPQRHTGRVAVELHLFLTSALVGMSARIEALDHPACHCKDYTIQAILKLSSCTGDTWKTIVFFEITCKHFSMANSEEF
jgi:hypothetical protein